MSTTELTARPPFVSSRRRFVVTAALAVTISAVPAVAGAQDGSRVHVRVAAGFDASRDTRFGDRACDAAPLLNFFGCQPGTDDRPIGARGDFGGSPTVDAAVGVHVASLLRVEAAVSHRPGFRFAGNSTFLNAGERQPAHADVSATAIVARVFFDLGPLVRAGRVEPFAGAGAGRSRNRIGGVVFQFPELAAQPATTTIAGGTRWSRAWDVSAGAAVRVAERTRIEGAYRYSDVGRVTTADGTIDVVRGERVFVVDDVAGTRARLQGHGMWMGIRRDF